MSEIEIHVHLSDTEAPKAIKIAEDATVDQLVKAVQAAGVAVGELGEEVLFLIENEEKLLKLERKLLDCGIKHGQHLHVGAVVIIVNTRERKWYEKRISYEEVVKVAFGPNPAHETIVYTVDYSHGPEHHRTGTLVKGQSVKVKCGMIFNVTPTNKS